MGAKGKYREWLTEDGLLLIKGWARDGLTDEQIAEKMHIGTTTFYRWQTEYQEIRESIKEGKHPVDIEVEDALKKKATGYFVTVKRAIKVKTKKQLKDKGLIEEEHIEYVDDEVYIPPDTTAQIFWLKNRKGDKWNDKKEVPVEDVEPVKVVFDV